MLEDFRSTESLLAYDRMRAAAVEQWKRQNKGHIAECVIEPGSFWHRNFCINRRATLAQAATELSEEGRLVKTKLNKCWACWNKHCK